MTIRRHDREQHLAKVGAWRSIWRLGDLRLKQVLWPEGLPALVVGGGGAVAVVSATAVSERIALMDTVIQLAAALLAVVFTALAIMVALPAGSYLRALQKDDAESDGMQRFLEPFLLALGVQVAVVLLALGYSLGGLDVSPLVEHCAFYALGFLLVYGLLDVVALARSIVRHGIGRAQDAVRQAKREETITSLPDRRSSAGS